MFSEDERSSSRAESRPGVATEWKNERDRHPERAGPFGWREATDLDSRIPHGYRGSLEAKSRPDVATEWKMNGTVILRERGLSDGGEAKDLDSRIPHGYRGSFAEAGFTGAETCLVFLTPLSQARRAGIAVATWREPGESLRTARNCASGSS